MIVDHGPVLSAFISPLAIQGGGIMGLPEDLKKMFVLRRILNPMGTTDAIEFLLSKLKQTKTNSEFFDSMNT